MGFVLVKTYYTIHVYTKRVCLQYSKSNFVFLPFKWFSSTYKDIHRARLLLLLLKNPSVDNPAAN